MPVWLVFQHQHEVEKLIVNITAHSYTQHHLCSASAERGKGSTPGLLFFAYLITVGTNPRLLKFIPSGDSDYLSKQN